MSKKQDVIGYFASIAERYDLLNHVLSFQVDRLWRRRLIKLSQVQPDDHVIDLCTGTCDVLLDFYRVSPTCSYVGVDITPDMLRIGRVKLNKKKASHAVELVEADVCSLPIPDASFDIATMAFGLRNLEDPLVGIREMARILKPGARLLILEFAPQQPGLFGRLYALYLKYGIPRMGAWLTGSKAAYVHLSSSIQGFLRPERVVAHMEQCGCAQIQAVPLTGKIAYIYVGIKQTAAP